ncbi:universal stress protein [Pontibacter indicus]|uniref:Nucleotide-binding universal stress protein, UspA family n=1 Tax=Pontibacter indicus TaxID=1317125 RepID=A0A1R3X1B8_9BACT|nr:universal stress protein [Pontibacter indicus]SIT83049.1 Nucleotide-binding universal stress protein, UspA family [Pontibacter indicus]
MRRILVPTDFSEQAYHAFEVAVAIARQTGAAIKLLHVVEMPYSQSFSVTGDLVGGDGMEQVYMMKLLETTKSRMAQLERSVEHAGVEVVQEVDADTVIRKIRRVIKEDQVDLVVMGSKGASGMNEFLLGSNTEKVVRTAECPVLTIKGAIPNFRVRNIVLPSDFKREIGTAMEKFKYFQQMFGATLHLVYVNTPGAFESNAILRTRMQTAAERYGLQNYTSNVYNDVIEENGILNFAEEVGADLIMMATHGRTGLAHLLSGSIAEDLVNHSDVPVLTFHLK